MTGRVLLPVVLLVFVVSASVLHRYIERRREPLRAAAYIGCVLGIIRATLATGGWYTVEHTGGLLQIPAFALAMLAWPEAMVFTERRTSPAPPDLYVRLFFLLVTSTFVMMSLVGAVATFRRRRRDLRPPGH